MRNLPAVKQDTIIKKSIAKEKDKDRGEIFDSSKVQMKLLCDGLNFHRFVYSNKKFRAKGGPTKSGVEGIK